MSAWDNLSIRDKAEMMRVAIGNGITNINDIKREYNEFAEGGNIYAMGTPLTEEQRRALARQYFWENKMDKAQQYAVPDAYEGGQLPEIKVFPERNQGEITPITGNALSRAINNYTGELKYDLANGRVPGGKYTLPAAVLGATGIAGLAKAGEMAYAAGMTPYISAGIDAAAAMHALPSVLNGTADWSTALEMTPLIGPVTRTGVQGARYTGNIYKALTDPRYRALHAYNAVMPSGYYSAGERAKDWIVDMIKDNPVNLKNPLWYRKAVMKARANGIKGIPDDGYTKTGAFMAENVENRGLIGDQARIDAWALYNGLDQQYGTYKKIGDGLYTYDLDNLMKKSNGTWHHDLLRKNMRRYGKEKLAPAYDTVTGAGGGLTDSRMVAQDPYGNYILHIEDVNDYNPFSRRGDSLKDRALSFLEGYETKKRNWVSNKRIELWNKGIFGMHNSNPILRKLQNWMYTYGEGIGRDIPDASGNLVYVPDISSPSYKLGRKIVESDAFKKFSDKYKNFEIGTVSGGKPFKMVTNIPLHLRQGVINYGNGMVTPYARLKYGFNPDHNHGFSSLELQMLKNPLLGSRIHGLGGNMFLEGGLADEIPPTGTYTPEDVTTAFWQNDLERAMQIQKYLEQQKPKITPAPIKEYTLPEVTVTPTSADDAAYRESVLNSYASIPQGEIRQTPSQNPLVDLITGGVRNYMGELQYDLANNKPLSGKYTLPATVAAALGLSYAPTAISQLLTPGSALYSNPITQQLVSGTAAATGLDLATRYATGYSSHQDEYGNYVKDSGYGTVSDAIGGTVENLTGWNPNNNMLGQIVTESLNPGWAANMSHLRGLTQLPGRLWNSAVQGARNIRYSDPVMNTIERVKELRPYNFDKDTAWNRRLSSLSNEEIERAYMEHAKEALQTRYKYGMPYYTGIKKSYQPYMYVTDHGTIGALAKEDTRNTWRRITTRQLSDSYVGPTIDSNVSAPDFFINNVPIQEHELQTLFTRKPYNDLKLKKILGDERIPDTETPTFTPQKDWTGWEDYRSAIAQKLKEDWDNNGPLSSHLKRSGMTPSDIIDLFITPDRFWNSKGLDRAEKKYYIDNFINNAANYNSVMTESDLKKTLKSGMLKYIENLTGITDENSAISFWRNKLGKEDQREMFQTVFNALLRGRPDISKKFYSYLDNSYNNAMAFGNSGIYIPLSNKNFAEVVSHELGHLEDVHNLSSKKISSAQSTVTPRSDSHLFNKAFNMEKVRGIHMYSKPSVSEGRIEYLSGKNNDADATEMAQRATQIKDYFRLKPGEELTMKQLKYAAQHYMKDVMDNNMRDFFSTISDWKAALKWINTHGKATVPVAGTGTAAVGLSEMSDDSNVRAYGGSISPNERSRAVISIGQALEENNIENLWRSLSDF